MLLLHTCTCMCNIYIYVYIIHIPAAGAQHPRLAPCSDEIYGETKKTAVHVSRLAEMLCHVTYDMNERSCVCVCVA